MNSYFSRLKLALCRHQKELFIFFSLFVFIFSSVRIYPAGSIGNVEQWINLTNSMFARNQDFLFSYGPLYWLVGGVATPFNQVTYWLAVFFLSFNFAFFWTGLVLICIDAKRYIEFASAFLIFILTLQVNSALFLWPLIIVTYIEFYKERKITLSWKAFALLGAIVGFEFYVRFFFGLIACVIFVTYLISHLPAKHIIHSLFSFCMALFISYFIIGLLIFHNPVSLYSYIKINMQLNFGNSVDMTLDVTNTISTYICAFIVLVCFVIHTFIVRRYLLLTYVAIWVILFKLGFGRSDHYNTYFVVPMIIISLILVCEKMPIGRIIFGICFVSLFYMATHQTFPGAATIRPFATAFNFDESYNDRMKSIYSEYKLDSKIIDLVKDSTIDVYPYNNEYLIANDFNYTTRPLFQNYMTLTPVLDGMNRNYFESTERPEFVLWTGGLTCYSKDCNLFEGFDYKYTLNEDPLTSTSILNNYDISAITNGRGGVPVVLMKRKEQIYKTNYTTLTEQEMHFGVWYQIPEFDKGIVKVQPHFEFTLLGRLKNLLFRGGIVKVKYKTENGDVKEFRLNILNSASGVWASPLLTGITLESIQGEPVKALMFETDSIYYLKPTFTAKFIQLNNTTIHVKPRVINYNKLAILSNIDATTSIFCDGSIDEINNKAASSASSEVSSSLQVKGWLAASSAKGELYDQTLLVLKAANASSQFFSTHESKRPDVANAFKHAHLDDAGFSTLVDARKLQGDYSVSLAGLRGKKVYTCNNINLNIKFIR